jgi:membrane protease YdiL (CAAX protease family)
MLHSPLRASALTIAALLAATLIGVMQTAFIGMPPMLGFTYELSITLSAAGGWWRWQGARYKAAHWRGAPSLRLISASAGCVVALSSAQHYWLMPSDIPDMVEAATRSPWGLASSLLLLSLSAPLLEEALFRGWMLTRLRAQLGTRASIVVSAGAFALAHSDPSRAIGQFVGGVLLGAIVVRTGRPWLAVAAHSAANLGGVLDAIPQLAHLPHHLGPAYPVCCALLSLLAARQVRRLLTHSTWTTDGDALGNTMGSGRTTARLQAGTA